MAIVYSKSTRDDGIAKVTEAMWGLNAAGQLGLHDATRKRIGSKSLTSEKIHF